MIDNLTAGDTLNFTTAAGDYPASAGWSLVYRLIPRIAGPSPIAITSIPSGDDHLIQVGASITAGWPPGIYSWTCQAVRSGERQTLESGVTQILPDPTAATSLDTRTSSEVALDNINATLEGRASTDVQRYLINGRELWRFTVEELVRLQSHFRLQVQREKVARNAAIGLADPRRVMVRFGPPQ